MIPVKFPETVGGLQEHEGLIRFDGANLEIEFMSKDALLGVVKSATKTVTVPLHDIAAIEAKFGWFSSKLNIRFNSLSVARQFPGNEGPELQLTIKRADRRAAASLIAEFSSRKTEERVRKFQESLEKESGE
jgi:hypothetical protein